MKKVLSVLLLVALMAAFFVGCKEPTDKLRKVQLNEVTRSVFYAPQYIAASLGFFEKEGLDVEITTGGGSDKTMTALLAGQADIGLMGPETGVYVVNEGKEDHPIIIGQLTKRDGSFLVSRTPDDDFTWESLEGSTIIGGRRGGMPLMTLEYVLKQHGLTPGENVEVLDHIQFNLMGGAFEGGEGDFVTLFEPTASQFELEGKGHIIANIGEASGEVPYTTFMVSQSTLKNDPDLAERFIRAIYKAQQWIVTATDEEVAKAMQPYFPDSNIEVLTSVAKNYRSTDSWKTDPIMLEEDFQRLLDIMDEAGELKAPVEFTDLVNNSIAIKIMSE
ncbi:ABC transporter substrate-binding protein [Eubacteriales bacterium OttesenSCG-928-K08]|nr:ABC transporter substrate-binding protein [Eubacteriales bacterium OttesenSCG-928-K08]